MSTLEILDVEMAENNILSEDEMFTSRQAARHVVVALKKYFETHLAIRADNIRRSHARNEGHSPLAQVPAYKVRIQLM